jgi:hypothetical protein
MLCSYGFQSLPEESSVFHRSGKEFIPLMLEDGRAFGALPESLKRDLPFPKEDGAG